MKTIDRKKEKQEGRGGFRQRSSGRVYFFMIWESGKGVE